MSYLERFREKLEESWAGSLVSVREARARERNAKKYLSEVAQNGEIEKVTWGWYWIPGEYKDFFDFLVQDKHFKVLQKQTAAAVWNGDFVHRDHYTIAVEDSSYGRALEAFSLSRGWKVSVETRKLRKNDYQNMKGLSVEALESTIIGCVKEWSFTDAFAAVRQNYRSINWRNISRHNWARIARSDVRVGQILKYGLAIIARETGDPGYRSSRSFISDDFVRRQVEEAAEQVVDFAWPA